MASPKRILLLGASGIAGGAILDAFVQNSNYQIRIALLDGETSHWPKGVEVMNGDIHDRDFLASVIDGMDVVIHARGLVSFSFWHKMKLFEVNAEQTGHIINVALEMGVPHFIYIGSALGLGIPNTPVVIDEQTVWAASHLNTPYAESKYQSELEVWRGRQEGLGVSVLLPTMLLGSKGQGYMTNALLQHIRSGAGTFPMGGTHFLDAWDLGRFVHNCVDAGPTDERVLLCGPFCSYRELMTGIANELGIPFRGKQLSRNTASWNAWWNHILGRQGITPQEVRLLFREIRYNNAKAIQQYNFRFSSISETIQRMLSVDTRS